MLEYRRQQIAQGSEIYVVGRIMLFSRLCLQLDESRGHAPFCINHTIHQTNHVGELFCLFGKVYQAHLLLDIVAKVFIVR